MPSSPGRIRPGSAPSARLGRHRQAAALTLLGLIVASLAGGAFLLWRQERALEAQQRARSPHRASGRRRQRTGRSASGQPARDSRRARHGGRGDRPRVRVRPADDRADPLGRRLARRHDRLPARARREPGRGRGRGPPRRHRPGRRDARAGVRPHAPGPRQRQRPRPPGRRRRHRTARAAGRLRERPQVHGARGRARAHGRRRAAGGVVQGRRRRP